MNITKYWKRATKENVILTGSSLAILSILKTNRPWVHSQRRLAKELDLNDMAVLRAVNKLEELGFVERVHKIDKDGKVKRTFNIALVKEANV